MAVETTNYEVVLESKDPKFLGLFEEASQAVTQLVQVTKADKIETQVRAWVNEQVQKFKDAPLIWGGGASHIWVSISTTGERVILITFKNEYL